MNERPLVVFLEPRRFHARAEGRSVCETLAARTLAESALASELLARMGWTSVGPILVGAIAAELSELFPGLPPPSYPLLAGADPEAKAIQALIENSLHALGFPGVPLLLLLPTKDANGKRLGLRSIPEFLLKSGGLRMEPVTQPLIAGMAGDHLRWAWVFEETGTSLTALWQSEQCEDHLEITAGSGMEMRRCLEEVASRSLALHRGAWKANRAPEVEIQIAASETVRGEIERVLPPVLRRLRLHGARVATLTIAELLELAASTAPPVAPTPLVRPQAIRPRSSVACKP